MSSFQDALKRIPAPVPIDALASLGGSRLPAVVLPAQDFAQYVVEEMRAFDAMLDQEHEVAVCLASFDQSIIIHVDEIVARGSFFIVFRGRTNDGNASVTLIQHLTQANLLLVSAERLDPAAPKRPIGFAVEPAPEMEQR